MALTHYRDYTSSLASQPVRGMFGGQLGLDWIQGMIARGYGGHVEVASTDAGGTTFTVLLPRVSLGSEKAAG